MKQKKHLKYAITQWLIKMDMVLTFTYIVLIFITIIVINTNTVYATSSTTNLDLQNQKIDINNQQIINLNKKIAEYQTELIKVGSDKKTLNADIKVLTLERSKIETQISVTQHQIDTTKLQIKQFGSDIVDTQQLITKNQTAIEEYFRDIQEIDNQSFIEQILSPQTLTEGWNDTNTILQVQSAIKNKMEIFKTHKINLANLQNASKNKQTVLNSQNNLLKAQQLSLVETKKSKDQLLAETNAEESKYEELLSEAKAQLASFSTFTKNAGGSKLLTNQTSCDSWGCYYNQRDALWGNISLNNTKFRLASDGCLITSMAMVMTHYGYRDVTPETINSNKNNFATYYPAQLLYTIYVNGVTATRTVTTIDKTLATGNPVVVGVHAYGGTHFVVLTSGKNGKYLMRDPYVANAKDINFTDHYLLSHIYEINKVEINK